MKRRRVRPIKKIKAVVPVSKKETPKKRMRKNPVKKLIDSEFYTCNKTLRDGNGNICFIKGKDYLLQRNVHTKCKEYESLLLRSEIWGHHLVHKNSWGRYFTKAKRVEKLTEVEREHVNPNIFKWQESVHEFLRDTNNDTPEIIELQSRVINHMHGITDNEAIKKWHELVDKLPNKTTRTRRGKAVLSKDKPKRVRKVRATKETPKIEDKPTRKKDGGVPYGILHEKAIVVPRKRKRKRRR